MIVRLTGGMGNQLFMYAFGRSLSFLENEPLKFHWCRSTWDYALDPFKLPIEHWQADELNQGIAPLIYHESAFTWDRKVYQMPKDTYYTGYWQTEKYFNVDLLRRDFYWWVNSPLRVQFRNKAFIHVRRGDYLNRGTKEFHGLLPLEYYQAAVNYIKERVPNVTFEVFTDDPDMREFMGYPVVSTGNQHLDLHTMTKYSHAILANSTFGWWAAWLGEHSSQIVVAPKQWFADPKIDTSDLVPERWVRL
jgi:Glycosyl transferase family 11